MLWSRRKANSRAQDENESSNTKKEEQKVETKKESPHRKDENNKTSERKRDYSKRRPKTNVNKVAVESKLKVIPLGGLDEIGKNCAVIQYDNEMIIIDLGLAFPDETMPGIDLVIPDFSYVYKNIDKLKAIIITHGHEDHIGAVSHFYRGSPKKNIPLYSSKFTNGILKEKLKEKFRGKKFDLRDVDSRDMIHVGKNIAVEFVRITHSIPDAFVVAVHTPEGTVVHTGDYKFDLSPVDGKHVDFYKLAELGEKGTLLLLSDSTNANKEGFTPSEISVVRSFRDVLHKAKGRVICAVFSSHAHRVQEMVKVGTEFGRKTALDGRSMHRTFNVGQDVGSVVIPDDSIVPLSQAPGLPEDQILIVCTGTQGELMSAMSRAARGQHKDIKIEEGDVVVMSANSIPGNEVYIGRVVNQLVKRGAQVYKHGEKGLHVSGHGCRGDIALMLNLIKPKFFMPVHGEYVHLTGSKALAVDVGMKPEDIIITKNGDIVSVNKNGIAITGEVESGNVLVDNNNSNSVATATIKDRNMMAKDGLIVIHVLINVRSRKINGQPDIISKGFGSQNVIRDLGKDIVINFSDKKINDVFAFKKDLRDYCIKEIKRKASKEPMIIPIIATV
ncbi:MAG TPA: ribonuclease J [Fusobacteria bacterium]|nr:ribonuclease J [Fusobacteriota bacterium]|tara:strand:- start:3775 stop:5616 length:1842 start_codon:yes stop_codon:yes gene_type:complete